MLDQVKLAERFGNAVSLTDTPDFRQEVIELYQPTMRGVAFGELADGRHHYFFTFNDDSCALISDTDEPNHATIQSFDTVDDVILVPGAAEVVLDLVAMTARKIKEGEIQPCQ